MINDTIVTLQGHAGGPVTLRQAGDHPVAHLRVACTPRRRKRGSDEWVDGATQWYSVSAWRQLGEHCARSITTGDPVIVHGRLTSGSYVDKDGVEVTTMEVEALLVGHDLSRGISVFHKRPTAAEWEARAAAAGLPGTGTDSSVSAGMSPGVEAGAGAAAGAGAGAAA